MQWTEDDSYARACHLTGHFPCRFRGGSARAVQPSRLAEIPVIAVKPFVFNEWAASSTGRAADS